MIPKSDPDQARRFARSVNAFGIDLWRQIERGDQALSPASIAVALAMTLAGAGGETAAQMARVLHLDGDLAAYHLSAGAALERWQSWDELLAVANRLFLERRYPLEQPFVALIHDRYDAPIELMDLALAPERARAEINRWVAEQTRERIKDLIPPNGIDSLTRLVLTNAIYLRAKWLKPFDVDATRPADFHLDGGAVRQVPTMHASGQYRVGQLGDVQLLELPYRDAELAMLFVLPKARDGLDDLEGSLSADRLDAWVGNLSPQYADIALPKFRVAPATSLGLSKPLKAMGMTDAFDQALADFSSMANPPSPADRLHIKEAYHKAFVEVDESGTEAAAATAVVMKIRCAPGSPPTAPFVFRADHPFLFLLRDSGTGAVLFLGRTTNPAAS
jgi:serpin B